MVTVAQLAERWIVVPNVVGSSPISHPKTSETSEVFFCEHTLWVRARGISEGSLLYALWVLSALYTL